MNLLQEKLLEMLSWFHDFCQDNNLRYYVLGGTMLGAARHQGFIPWDDDIDVGMPRTDYEAFLKLTKNKKFGNYVTEGIDTPNNDFFYGYAKIYDTKSVLIENNRYRIKRGIFLDIFPLDGVANSYEDVDRYTKRIYSRRRLLLARTCSIRRERKLYKNLAICMARMIPGFLLDNKKLMLDIDTMCKQRDYDDFSIIGNLYGAWGKKEIVEKKIFGNPKLYKFENLEICGVTDYDGYLTSLYGNWRKLPPKEKQVTHHDFIHLDLETSYLEE